jgi:hypothetical protein
MRRRWHTGAEAPAHGIPVVTAGGRVFREHRRRRHPCRGRRHGIPGGIAAHDGLEAAPYVRKLADGSSPPGATRRRHPRRPP